MTSELGPQLMIRESNGNTPERVAAIVVTTASWLSLLFFLLRLLECTASAYSGHKDHDGLEDRPLAQLLFESIYWVPTLIQLVAGLSLRSIANLVLELFGPAYFRSSPPQIVKAFVTCALWAVAVAFALNWIFLISLSSNYRLVLEADLVESLFGARREASKEVFRIMPKNPLWYHLCLPPFIACGFAVIAWFRRRFNVIYVVLLLISLPTVFFPFILFRSQGHVLLGDVYSVKFVSHLMPLTVFLFVSPILSLIWRFMARRDKHLLDLRAQKADPREWVRSSL